MLETCGRCADPSSHAALTCSADLQTSAKLTVQTYLFKEAGTIDIGVNETMDVKRGTLKFNVEVRGACLTFALAASQRPHAAKYMLTSPQIRDWIFCDASATSGEPAYCKKGNSKQTGAWLDLEIEVKGKANNATLITQAQEREQREQQEQQRQQQQQQQQQQRPTRRHVPDEYSLGDGAVFGASTQVDNNGVWEPMADGYPKTVVRACRPEPATAHLSHVLPPRCRARTRRRRSFSASPSSTTPATCSTTRPSRSTLRAKAAPTVPASPPCRCLSSLRQQCWRCSEIWQRSHPA